MLGAVYRRVLRHVRPYRTIDFGEFRMTVDLRDDGGYAYLDPAYWAEVVCSVERDIVACFQPRVYLDVGANYGFTALLQHSRNRNCRIIAVEPSPVVVKL